MNSEISTQISTRTPEIALRLPSTRRGAQFARHRTIRQLDEWGLPCGTSVADSAAAVVAELAANAVTHGRVPGRDFELRLTLTAHVIRIEVSDTRTERRAPTPHPSLPPTDSESGRGLFLVQALSHAWGVSPRDTGKTMWAEIALSEAP